MHFDLSVPTYNQGIRLYDAVNLKFSTSTLTDPGIDEFATPGSPFDIKYVMMDYDASSGKQIVVGTEDDSNWNTLVEENTYDETTNTVPQHNWMVRFPKFYYKRPDRYTWLVSSDPLPEFSPSPMHYRNGVMHDYVYVSKYLISKYASVTTYRSATADDGLIASSGGFTIDEARNKFKKEGMYVFDYATYCSIAMLIMIKYATLNTRNEFGYVGTIDANTGSCLNVLSKDGINANDYTAASDALGTLILGLEDYVHTAKGIMIDGCGWRRVGTDRIEFYINTDLENIAGCPDFTSETFEGFIRLDKRLLAGHSKQYYDYDIGYDSTFDWALYPGVEVGATALPSGTYLTRSFYILENSATTTGVMKMPENERYDFLNFGLNKNRDTKNPYYRSIVY